MKKKLAFALLSIHSLVSLQCHSQKSNTKSSTSPLTAPQKNLPDPFHAEAQISLNLKDTDILNPSSLEPKIYNTLVVDNGEAPVTLKVFVKPIRLRKNLAQLELHFTNSSNVGFDGLEVEILSLSENQNLYDISNNPFQKSPMAPGQKVSAGAVAPKGVTKVTLAMDVLASKELAAQIKLRFSGVPFAHQAKSSAPLALSQDQKELWVVQPDLNRVFVMDTSTNALLTSFEVNGKPTSLDMSPDNRFTLVTTSESNEVVVIDRLNKSIVQRLSSKDKLGIDLRTILTDPNTGDVYVGGFVSDTISKLKQTPSGYELAETLNIGRRPTHMSLSPRGDHIVVSHFMPRGKIRSNEAWTSTISTTPLKLVKETKMVDNFNLKESICLSNVYKSRFPQATPELLTTEGVNSQLAGVFLHPAGHYGWVPGTKVPGGIPVYELGPNHGELSKTFFTGRKGEFTSAFNFMLDTRNFKDVENIKSFGVLDMDDVSYEQLECGQYDQESEFLTATYIDGNKQITIGPNQPTALTGLQEASPVRFVAFTPSGRQVAMLSYSSDQLLLVDGTTFHPLSKNHYLLPGNNPTGMVFSQDGSRAYVTYANSRNVTVLNTSELESPDRLTEPKYLTYRYNNDPIYRRGAGFLTSHRIERNLEGVLAEPPITQIADVTLSTDLGMPAKMLRGKILFESANPKKHPTLSVSTLGSCTGCHPEGGTDGSLWSTMEGERRTMSLWGGVAGRGWLHASSTHADSLEFADIIVTERLGGHLSKEDVDSLANYVSFGLPTLQSPKTDPLKVAQGKILFEKSCAGCHQGNKQTSGNPDSQNPLGGADPKKPASVFNVGTATEFAGAGTPLLFEILRAKNPEAPYLKLIRGDRDLGSADPVQKYLDFRPRPDRKRGYFKAPALTGTWHNVLFFHDGRFDSLQEVVVFFNNLFGLELDSNQQESLVEYLKTL
jgi:DNA-binding beta-propeller fold protein YncE